MSRTSHEGARARPRLKPQVSLASTACPRRPRTFRVSGEASDAPCEAVHRLTSISGSVPLGRGTSVPQRDLSLGPSASQPPSALQQRIRVNQMKKRVAGLCDAATAYFQHISSARPDAAKEREEREVWDGEKQALSDAFSPLRIIYSPNPGQLMISTTEVHGQLNIPEDDPSWAATTRAIAMANIASLWETMVNHKPRDLKFLHLLESTFPDFYIPLTSQGYTMDNDSILHQVQEIRTQHLILKLGMLQTESPHPFNPYQEILKIFCQPHVGIDNLLQAMQNNLDGLGLKGVPGMVDDDWSWRATSMTTRISALCKELPNEDVRDVSAQLPSLEDGYSFDSFLADFKDFTRACFATISAQFSQGFSQNDANSQIQSQLEAELARANAAAGTPRYVEPLVLIWLLANLSAEARLPVLCWEWLRSML